MVKNMNTKYTRMGDMLMPVSMALVNEFDDNYLGIGDNKENTEE
jgi:hypothetical protein